MVNSFLFLSIISSCKVLYGFVISISEIQTYIIKYIDIIMYKIDNMSFDLIYFHYTVAYFYISLLISV